MKYREQIKHPLWQKKRLEILEANDFSCEQCSSKEITLHVHHTFYKRGAMIWDYEIWELKCLCENCHKEEHALDEIVKKEIAILDQLDKKRLLGFVRAYKAIQDSKIPGLEDEEMGIEVPSDAELEGILFLFPKLSKSDIIPLLEDISNCPPGYLLLSDLIKKSNPRKRRTS